MADSIEVDITSTHSEKKRLAKQQGKKYKDDDNDFYDPVIDFVCLEEWNAINFNL